jgi:hypothetical protein
MNKIETPARLRVDIGDARQSVEVVQWNVKTVWVRFLDRVVKRHRRKHNARI